MRAEEVLVHPPALVRGGGETAGEEVLFVLAQAGHVLNSPQNAPYFFFHDGILADPPVAVETNLTSFGVAADSGRIKF